MSKTYLVTYKTRPSQTVQGDIAFFSSINTDVVNDCKTVYLNADEVVSVTQQVQHVTELLVSGNTIESGKEIQ